MKKGLSFLSSIIMISLSAFGQNDKVIFSGTTDAMYNGSKIVLYNNATKDKDSAIVTDGKFSIAVTYKEPTRYFFYSDFEIKKKGGYAPYGIIVTAPGEVKMKTDMETMTKTTATGAPENELFAAYTAEGAKVTQARMDKLSEKYGKEFVAKPDPKDPKYKDLVAEYQAMAKADQPAEMDRMKGFVRKNPSSYSALLVLSGAINSLDANLMEELYGMLSSKYGETAISKRIHDKVESMKLTAIGKPAPEFAQADTAGNMVKLSDFRGKYVLIDFWASWCGPCRAENPNVVNAYNTYNQKGFTVFGVSLDQPGQKQKWVEAIHKDNLTWTHVSDLQYWNNAVAKQYGINAIPQNYLVDPSGKIIASNIRGDELKKKLQELFPN